jgi:hypothetical protein
MWKQALIRHLLVCLVTLTSISCALPKNSGQPQKIENNRIGITYQYPDWAYSKDASSTYVVVQKNFTDLAEGISFQISFNIDDNISHRAHISLRSQEFKFENKVFLSGSEMFFRKNSDYFSVPRDSYGIPSMMTQNLGNEKYFRQEWLRIIFVKGLRCLEGMYFYKQDNKFYTLICGYIDKFNQRKILRIAYEFERAIKYDQWKEFTTLGKFPQKEPENRYLKQAVKEIIDSLVIKDMDINRMRLEGIFHPGKEFEISPY